MHMSIPAANEKAFRIGIDGSKVRNGDSLEVEEIGTFLSYKWQNWRLRDMPLMVRADQKIPILNLDVMSQVSFQV